MGFSRQEDYHGKPFPIPRDLSTQGWNPLLLASPALAGRFFTWGLKSSESSFPCFKSNPGSAERIELCPPCSHPRPPARVGPPAVAPWSSGERAGLGCCVVGTWLHRCPHLTSGPSRLPRSVCILPSVEHSRTQGDFPCGLGAPPHHLPPPGYAWPPHQSRVPQCTPQSPWTCSCTHMCV